MRIKLDENLPAALVSALAALGHDADTSVAEGLGGARDVVVWAAAQREGRFFVTQDLDFSDRRAFAPGSHAGILLVRLGEEDQWRLTEHVVSCLSSEDAKTWTKCLVIASSRKVRVIRPKAA